MKIYKNPSEIKPKTPISNDYTLSMISKGTLFRYGSHTCGPYMRTDTGYVNLGTGTLMNYPDLYTVNNYKLLPDAYLVTGEKD